MPFCMFNHPFLFAAVAVVAIGVVVYELIEENKRRQPISRRRPPPNGPSGSPPSDRPKSPPCNPPGPPFTPESPISPPGSNLRRRNINQTSYKDGVADKLEESKNHEDLESAVRVAPETYVENLNKTPSTSGNQNVPDKKFDENNYCKNMLDKLTNDTKNVNKNITGELLGHNIYEDESDSSENNFLLKGEEKVINQAKSNENACNSKKPYKRKRKTKCPVEKSAKSHIDKKHDNCSDHCETKSSSETHSDNSGFKSHSSNLYPKLDFHPLSNSGSELVESSLSSDEDEANYKKDMIKALRNDLQDCEIIYNTDNPVTCSSKDIEKEEPSEFKLCKGCEENQVNTRAYPCNHAYLCVDCAIKVFRLFKRCTICLQDVEEFVQFAL